MPSAHIFAAIKEMRTQENILNNETEVLNNENCEYACSFLILNNFLILIRRHLLIYFYEKYEYFHVVGIAVRNFFLLFLYQYKYLIKTFIPSDYCNVFLRVRFGVSNFLNIISLFDIL